MNLRGLRRVPHPEASAGPWVIFVQIFQDVSTPNLIRALAAILFWSALIGVASLCYELWRLEHDWRLAWNGGRNLGRL